MLAQLRMKLKPDCSGFGYYQSSNLQGVLMEQINSDYAEKLHQQGWKPYSQFLYCKNEEFWWFLHTWTKEAYHEILLPLQDSDFVSFQIKKKGIQVSILQKEISILPKKALMEEFYSHESSRYLSIEFLSPTAFKQNGRYVNYPDLRLIFQSLMNKYSAGSSELNMFDEETLEQLVSNMFISRYSLHSVSFPLEGVRIPAFMGTMTIRVNGTKTMANYARLLLRFGEYSGVGIKTGMGMGAVKWIEKENV